MIKNENIIICLNNSSPIGERLSKNKIKLIDLKINNIFSGFFAVYKIFLFLIENKNINVVQGWMYFPKDKIKLLHSNSPFK